MPRKKCRGDEDYKLVWMKFIKARPRISNDGKPVAPPRGPYRQHTVGLIYAVLDRFKDTESYPFWEYVRDLEGDELEEETITLEDGSKCDQLIIQHGDEMAGQTEPSPGLEVPTTGGLSESGFPKMEIANGMDKQTLVNLIKSNKGEASMDWTKEELVQAALQYL